MYPAPPIRRRVAERDIGDDVFAQKLADPLDVFADVVQGIGFQLKLVAGVLRYF